MPTPIVQVPTGLIYQTKDLDKGAELTVLAAKSFTGTGNLVCADSPTISTQITVGATAITAADAVTLGQIIDQYGWYDVQRARAIALLGDGVLTNPPAMGNLATYAPRTGLATGSVRGGGMAITAGEVADGNNVHLTSVLLTNPKTQPFYLAWRAAYKAPAGTSYELGWFGLVEQGNGGKGVVLVECATALLGGGAWPAGASTNFILLMTTAAGASSAVDTGVAVDADVMHDWALANDATTLTLQRDGVAVYSSTDLAAISTTPVSVAGRGNAGHSVVCSTFVCFT